MEYTSWDVDKHWIWNKTKHNLNTFRRVLRWKSLCWSLVLILALLFTVWLKRDNSSFKSLVSAYYVHNWRAAESAPLTFWCLIWFAVSCLSGSPREKRPGSGKLCALFREILMRPSSLGWQPKIRPDFYGISFRMSIGLFSMLFFRSFIVSHFIFTCFYLKKLMKTSFSQMNDCSRSWPQLLLQSCLSNTNLQIFFTFKPGGI